MKHELLCRIVKTMALSACAHCALVLFKFYELPLLVYFDVTQLTPHCCALHAYFYNLPASYCRY
jgi:hypothetical protein